MGDSDIKDTTEFEQNVSSGSARGIPIEVILKGMDQTQINTYLLKQYSRLSDQYDDLSANFKAVIGDIKAGNKNVVDRIEHILALMTSNMMFVKQMIQLENTSVTRLNDQEKVDAKLELQFSTVINKQNQFSQCIDNMNKNSKIILEEIEVLRANDIRNDKFKTKVTVIASICTVVVYWILSGINFGKIVEVVKSFR